MKITLNREELLKKVLILEKATINKTDIPSLSFIKFDNGKLTMSDNNVVITTKIECDNEFKALIPFKTLKDILSKLKDKNVDFTLEDNTILIKCNKSSFKLNTTNFAEYPDICIKKLEKSFKIKSNEFKTIINNVAFSCSTNDKRPILTGVNFSLNENKLKCVATDSFRLSQQQIEIDNQCEMNVTISKKDLNNLIKLIPNDIELDIRYDENNIVFQFDDVLYKCRLLAGNFPQTDKIVDIYALETININVEELKEMLDRLSVFKQKNNDKETNIVKFKFVRDSNVLTATSRSVEIGNAKETIELSKKWYNNNIEIYFNGDYLLEALKCYSNIETVNINIVSEMKPFTITNPNDKYTIQLLLPIKAQ